MKFVLRNEASRLDCQMEAFLIFSECESEKAARDDEGGRYIAVAKQCGSLRGWAKQNKEMFGIV